MTTQRGIVQSYDADFREYDDPATVQKYRRATAGEGINYLLPHVYGPVFLAAARAALAETGGGRLRAIEFGCGAGMAIHHVAEEALKEGIELDLAVGADFVPAMVEAARLDVEEHGTPDARAAVRYVVATNERLADETAEALDIPLGELEGTFHLALGVNTFRYPVRHGLAADTVAQLDRLLAPGGRVVNIDMNDRFPYGVKPRRRTSDDPPGRLPVRFGTQSLPSLDEYARPFRDGGFEILEIRHLAWIPHSASGIRFRATRAASGLLDRLVPTRAMRTVVIARKPA